MMRIDLDSVGGAYEPGAVVSGIVVADDGERLQPREVVFLEWTTEGKGGHDAKCIAECVTTDGRFSLETPLCPWTFHGKLLSVEWRIRCRGASRPIVVAPDGAAVEAP